MEVLKFEVDKILNYRYNIKMKIKNIYGGELSKRNVIWNEDKEMFVCKKKLEEGKYYWYDCDVSNERFVFWKKDGKISYDVGDVDDFGDWILVEKRKDIKK